MTAFPRLLVIEDDPIDRMAFERLVASGLLACDYTAVDSVAAAQRTLAAESFDAILADFNIHGGTGLDAVGKWLTAIPTIFITGSGCEEIAVEAMKAGAFDYLVKDVGRHYLTLLPKVVARALEDQRKKRALQESERRYQDLFENCSDLIQSVGPDGRILYVNRAWRETLGYAEKEATGLPILNIIAPDCRAHCGEVFQRLMGGQKEDTVNTTFLARDGRRIELEGRINIHRENGRPVATRGIFRDVTARRKAEDQLKRLNAELEQRALARAAELRQAMVTLDAIQDGAFIFDPGTLRFGYVNQGAVRQLGYSREELLGLTPLDIKPEFDEARFRRLLAPLVTGERESLTFTTLHRRKDGRDVPVEINLQHIAPPGDKPRFIALVRDITERQALEQRAHRTQRLESLGTLAGGIAHDLNNALTPVMATAELLREEYPRESETLAMMTAGVHRARDMIRQLLTFARGVEGERVPLSLDHLVKEMIGLIAATFPKNIELKLRLAPDTPAVRGDSTQLHQVLLNLCVNARDAMPDGGILTLESEAMEVDATVIGKIHAGDPLPGRYSVLRVRDTGTGMSPEVLDRIFDPFFTTKAPDKGTGLGLSNVLGIVKGHGGLVQVDSQLGRGTVFSIFLPADTTEQAVEIAPTSEIRYRGNRELVLFVDDEDIIRRVAKTLLERLNFVPLLAKDGVDALAQVAQHRDTLRLIVTDISMPNLDGLGFVRALRQTLPAIPVIVTTGRLDTAALAEFKQLEVSAFLEKPFNEPTLIETVQVALQAAPVQV